MARLRAPARVLLGSLGLVASLAAPARAGPGVWTTGGPYGGNVTALAIDPGDRSHVIAATSTLTGVFESHDGGVTWGPTFFPANLAQITCLAFDPTNPKTIYAGIAANGVSAYVARSIDGGRSWSPSSFGSMITFVPAIAVDPLHPSTLHAATDRGAFKSLDGGATWTAKNTGLPDCGGDCGLRDLAIDPSHPLILFALPGGSVYRTENGGESWLPAGTGIPPGAFAWAVAIDPFDDRALFVGSTAGVFKSTNGGASWSLSLHASLPFSDAIVSLAFDPTNPQHAIAVSGGSGIFETENVGVSWNETSSIATFGSREAIAFGSAGILLLSPPGSGIGVVRSNEPAKGWVPSNEGIQGINVGTVVSDPFDARRAYAVDFFSNLYGTWDSGASWAEGVAGIGALAPDPSHPGVLYAGGGSSTSAAVEKSMDGGASWQPAGTILNTGDRFSPVQVAQLAVASGSSGVLYAIVTGPRAGGFFRSEDGGVTWETIAPTLGVGEIALDRSSPSSLYVVVTPASDAGASALYWSSDFGATFELLSSLPGGVSGVLAVAPGSPFTLYYAATEPIGNRIDVFRSTNGGVSWNPAGTSLPGFLATGLVVSPLNAREVFLASVPGGPSEPGGVFRSRDGGSAWEDFSGGLPDRNVFSLAIDPSGRLLHAATLAGVYEFSLGRANVRINPVVPVHLPPISGRER